MREIRWTIIDEKCRWCDLALQKVAHLACEIVARLVLCRDYQEVYIYQENFDGERIQRLISKITKDSRPLKRKFTDIIHDSKYVPVVFSHNKSYQRGQQEPQIPEYLIEIEEPPIGWEFNISKPCWLDK
ncbi:7440_t:CDS:2 [Funneliformis geosporum]|nr:7440_t:CDS:2 [Funneliformis geosporum]